MGSYDDGYRVFLDLASRADGQAFSVNRIMLNCSSVGISTGKTVMAFPVPFSGLVTGESSIASLDLGMADKTIQLSGTIFETTINKIFDVNGTDTAKDIKMTSHEICQLIHSYVDSSVLQQDQNLNRLTILIPSRADADFAYHSGVNADTDISALPTIPFTYKVRNLDNRGGLGGLQVDLVGDFPSITTDGTNVTDGLQGFIRNFNTTFTGESNFIEFSMDFQIATMSL